MNQEKNIETETPKEEKSFFGIIVHSFFIIPFLIAVFCVLLFTAIHLLTRENRSVYDYLEDVKTGGLTKRWQGAFELSKILANPKLIPDDTRFVNELIAAFEHSAHDDPRVRQYLAFAMGRTEKKEFTETLINSLDDEKEETVAASIYALGMLKDSRAIARLEPFLESQNSRIRSITVTALGTIADETSLPLLRKALLDTEPNVQWGAAISLAGMKDLSGKEILLNLLNREYLSQFPEVDPNEQNQLILFTIDSIGLLYDDDIFKAIKILSTTDTNMKVRARALDAINNKEKS